jgi:predicted dehydrogenase
MIDLLRLFVGEVAAASASLTHFTEGPGPDGQPAEPANDAAVLALRFANGAQGMLQLSAVAHMGDAVQRRQFVLHGEDGTLEADQPLTPSFYHGWKAQQVLQAALDSHEQGRWVSIEE